MLSPVHSIRDFALLVLRLAIGAIFLYHGMQKWGMTDSNAIMTILKFAEPLGGLALILGVLTPLASLGLAIIMLGAIFMKATAFGTGPLNLGGSFAPQGGMGWEFDLVLLAGCLALMAIGAGKWSIDAAMKKA